MLPLNGRILHYLIAIILIEYIKSGGIIHMAKCEYCGKSVSFGLKVSHSNRKSNRIWRPNIRKIKAVLNGSNKTVKVCTRCLRSNRVKRAV